MDPNTTFVEMVSSINHRNYFEARRKAIALKEWVSMGKTSPSVGLAVTLILINRALVRCCHITN